MPMYGFIEYSDNYSDTSGSLWQFKRDEPPANNFDLNVNNGVFNSELFKNKAVLVGKTANVAGGNSFIKKDKSSCSIKVNLELNWIEDCILSSVGNSAKFKITDGKLHVTIVTLSTKDNVNLTKQLSNGFKRSVCWNSYQTIPVKVKEKGDNIYELLSASFQVLKDYLFLVMLLV